MDKKSRITSVVSNMKWRHNVFPVCAYAFFIFTMICNLTHSAPWGDEWVEYAVSQRSIRTGALYQAIIGTFQPPLYNFLMHFWLKIDKSILWFRLFNVVLGMGSGMFVLMGVKKLYDLRCAGITVCALAACYRWVYCTQECSEYALMLFGLFGSIYFYIILNERFSYIRLGLFVVFCVISIYSQYGAVFVALPLLAVYYFKVMSDRETGFKTKVWLNLIYAFCLFVFAFPLYHYFLSIQLRANQIADHAVSLNIALFSDVFTALGRILGYLYSLNRSDDWMFLWDLAGIFLLAASVYLLCAFRHKLSWTKKSLIQVLWLAFLFHFILVKLHVYAMVHPDVSAGLYERYSYFYIPIFCYSLPVILCELKGIPDRRFNKNIVPVLSGIGLVCLYFSLYSLLNNWDKAYDNRFAEIWISNRGWENKTYCLGPALYSSSYYISHAEGYKEGYLDNLTGDIDLNSLPDSFWIWKLSWGDYGTIINKAKEEGYTIIEYAESGWNEELTFCYIDRD